MNSLDRRTFISLAAAGTLASCSSRKEAAPTSPPVPLSRFKQPHRTLVREFHDSLTAKQQQAMCFDWHHPKRSYVNNNWDIVDSDQFSIGEFYSDSQQQLIREIFRSCLSAEGYRRYMIQMKDDAGSFEDYTCAVFGKPQQGPFEWLLTGRHLTLRADGNSLENAAFGGPIFYGHAPRFHEKADHPGNVWWYQAKLVNALFTMMSKEEQQAALLSDSPRDRYASIGKETAGHGVEAARLGIDSKKQLQRCIDSLFVNFRQTDADEARRYLEAAGGLDSLRIAYYEAGDTGSDRVWDRWKIHGPSFAWYFRGSPHVHAWVEIGKTVG